MSTPMTYEATGAGRSAVVVGPHPMLLEGVRAVLDAEGVSVVATADSTCRAPDLVARREVDMLVADMDGPEGFDAALEAVRESCQRHPRLVAVALAAEGGTERHDAALAAGAVAYVLKSAEPQDVAGVVRRALVGAPYVADGAPAFVADVRLHDDEPQPRDVLLTRREHEVLKLAAEGRSNRDIARVLWVTDQTVKFHLGNAYRKLGAANRFEAARIADALGLFGGDGEPATNRRDAA